jgi:dihydrofolate synthase / folylpolyglutamate synthase
MTDSLRSAEDFIFASYMQARPVLSGPDERTRRPELTAQLLATLGHPERGLPCLLVAGSKGKGSTAAFAAGLLGSGGRRVGLFTSPHLLDIRERIRVDGRAIPPADFVELARTLRSAAEPLAASLPEGAYLSPVGLLLCVALLHFRARGVGFAVVEAGRGARFDDTRLVEHPVAAISPVMPEHRRELGPGLARIAWHKAGAIGPDGTAVSASQRPAVLDVLRKEAIAQGSRLLMVGRDVRIRRHRDGRVDVATERRHYGDLRPSLRGPHQAENLALALAATEALWPGLAELPLTSVQKAAARLRWPGRCETLQEHPLVLLDGAVNAAIARAFLAAARPISRPPIVAIAGAPADKDYAGLFRTLAPHVRRLYVTRASNPHLSFPPDAANVAARYAQSVTESPDLAAAVSAALAEVGPDGTVWVVGTQSLVADALRLWGRDLERL